MVDKRVCGVLVHPTSLPGKEGIGTFGKDAIRFLELLSSLGVSAWQVLPFTPPACGNSPYSAFSAFAGNPLLVDLEQLIEEGDLPHDMDFPQFTGDYCDFEAVTIFKTEALDTAANNFFNGSAGQRLNEFWNFCNTSAWLHNYALFMSLKKKYHGKAWSHWPADVAKYTTEAYEKYSIQLGPEIGRQKYIQWQFNRQWQRIKSIATGLNIKIIGDIPLFVAYDSADVWCNRDYFLLDLNGKPTSVAGVPPDYFSKTGQLWGNPLYNWNKLKENGYDWWLQRLSHSYTLFDIVRIDHFRGMEAAWHVPSHHKTAQKGTWVKGPGRDFFDVIRSCLGKLPIIAEDLGVVTDEVESLLEYCGFPGMKILQFAFDSGPDNKYLPHNHIKNCVVYTGTHDNNTTRGWVDGLTASETVEVMAYLGCQQDQLVRELVHTALKSVADTVVIPLQDILELPEAARMNGPGAAYGNWMWRFSWDQISAEFCHDFNKALYRFGRLDR